MFAEFNKIKFSWGKKLLQFKFNPEVRLLNLLYLEFFVLELLSL